MCHPPSLRAAQAFLLALAPDEGLLDARCTRHAGRVSVCDGLAVIVLGLVVRAVSLWWELGGLWVRLDWLWAGLG